MVRISKLTDYGIIIMSLIAVNPGHRFQAREIAERSQIAAPTVAKLLKKLAQQSLLTSQRGIHGGYQLTKDPGKITVTDLINALEGPIAITECNLGHDYCTTEANCTLRKPMLKINQIITKAFDSMTLSDLISQAYGPTTHSSKTQGDIYRARL